MSILVSSCEGTGLNPMSFTDQHGSIVLERLRYQREMGRFCDVAIIVKDRQFSAHRNILASCSPYFDSIFKSTKVAKEQVVVNSNSPKAFELLLNYMYSGSVIIDRAVVSELLRLANNFLVTKLKNYCAEYLDRYLDAANCISVKLLAMKYNLPLLQKAASDYFDHNINRCLLESVDILRYSLPQLSKVIEDPKYQDVISPDVHLRLIVRWVEHDVSIRESLFPQLIDSCSVDQITSSTLEDILDYSSLLKDSHTSRYLLLGLMDKHKLNMDKYQNQFISLSQQLGDSVSLDRPQGYYDDDYDENGENMEDEEMEEHIVEGQPNTSEILESNYDDNGVEKPRLRLKINLGSRRKSKTDSTKLYKRALTNSLLKRKGRIPKDNVENDILPMLDDDDIDGVYATGSLTGNVVTYTDEDFFDPEEIEDGEDVSVDNGAFRCSFCRFSCVQSEDLEKHNARVHNRNVIYMCQLCDVEENWSKKFYDHCKMAHWQHAPYQCDQCEFVAPDRIQDLLSHRLSHTQDRFFKCFQCSYRVRTKSQLWAHERMHSRLDDRPIHCQECGRGFHNDTALQLHQNTHDVSRNFVCDECGFMSNNVDHLNLHRKQHTGDSCYCHIEGCNYVSPKKSQLAAHLRTHMHIRSHKCQMCGRAFIEKSHLVRHERIHLVDKPFKCDQCDYASSRRDKLKEHILKHHNGSSVGSKSHRRRYRRARQLAVLNAQARLAPQDALFRPIPPNEIVSQWAENSASFQASRQDPSFSPQRAFSVTNPAPQTLASLSPGSMSLMNVHLNGTDNHHSMVDPITTPQLITPSPSSPLNPLGSDPFLNARTDADLPGTSSEAIHRPMSLPPYGQPTSSSSQQPPWW